MQLRFDALKRGFKGLIALERLAFVAYVAVRLHFNLSNRLIINTITCVKFKPFISHKTYVLMTSIILKPAVLTAGMSKHAFLTSIFFLKHYIKRSKMLCFEKKIDVGCGYFIVPRLKIGGFKMIDVFSSLSQYVWLMDSV